MVDSPDFIPDEAMPAAQGQQAPSPAASTDNAPDFIPDEQVESQGNQASGETKYGIHGFNLPQNEGERQLGKAELESGIKGFAGHAATALGEKGLTALGVQGLTPEDQAAREEYLKSVNPALPALTEAAGFGVGVFSPISAVKAFTGAGELLRGGLKLGEVGLAAKAAAMGAEKASIASRLAAGSIQAGSELAAMQTDDEISKAVNGTSKGIGDAITNVGLAAALGGIGGGALSGVGMAGKSIADKINLPGMIDRFSYRASGINPQENLQNEMSNAITTWKDMRKEMTGEGGVKSQVVDQLSPKSYTPAISNQVQEVADKANASLKEMMSDADLYPIRLTKNFQRDLNIFENAATNAKTPADSFKAMDEFKRRTAEYYPWGRQPPKTIDPEYGFLQHTEDLRKTLQEGLTNEKVWGELGGFQNELNAAYSNVIKPAKMVEGKFFTDAGHGPEMDPGKFKRYVNEAGRFEDPTIKQQIVENFSKGLEDFNNARISAYTKRGLVDPRGETPIPMGAIKESLGKTPFEHKFADAMYDKLGPEAIGRSVAALGGGLAGSLIGGGGVETAAALASERAFGKMISAFIKPIMEKTANTAAFRGGLNFIKNVAQGNQKLVNAAAAIFGAGVKTVPNHYIPDIKQITGLDEKLKKLQNDHASLLNVSGNLDHYLPEHAQKLGQTAMNAVNFLNSQRPSSTKVGILDADIPPSKAQEADFNRKLQIAEQPLMPLQHIQDGTLLPSDVSTLKTLYPDHYPKMVQQLMTAMTDHIHGGGTIPYKIRQGLSLFMGQPLDSTMQPASIMAIQGTFAKAPAQQPPGGGKAKGSTAKLGKMATNLQTQEQSREARANKA
jgi:hypothetical protein